jgi:hypothetical protein
MEKSVEYMTLQKLRDELHRTRPAMIENAHRHQLVQKELRRRSSSG